MSAVMEEDGVVRLRSFEREERNLRRMRWGRKEGIEDQEKGFVAVVRICRNGEFRRLFIVVD